MNAKKTIRKILFITIWLCIGGGMFILLMAAINKKNKGQCSGYTIVIKGEQENLFIDRNDVEQMLMKATNGNIKGEQVSSFKLHDLKSMLEKNTWIRDAELYFDNKDALHVTINEREPVARIFTTGNSSFYLDSTGKILPLSDKLSARVPVFTGFPERKTLTSKDSSLLNDVKEVAVYIVHHPFWMAQVAQVDLTTDKKLEMIPLVGNHLVKLGNADNIDQKFRRLMIFYQQVLSKTGFDKYKVIDVQYKGQVLVSKYAGDPRIDSIQLRRNVEKLLKQSIEGQNDALIKTKQAYDNYEIDSSDAVLSNDNENPEHKLNPNPGLSISTPAISEKSGGQAELTGSSEQKRKTDKPKKEEKKRPKAVMPEKPVEDENGGYN
ncbi:MAG: hypothetical protein HZB42_00660 [Sphingobacteriales bacterium]|nr:hypothetical protein [Sphingobacteriales bacterium]